MLRPKKNSYKEFDDEKKFLRLENSPPPPITFLMVRPLTQYGQLSPRQTPLGPALSVRLREVSVLIESQIKGVKKGRVRL